jgi:hypothetical protein
MSGPSTKPAQGKGNKFSGDSLNFSAGKGNGLGGGTLNNVPGNFAGSKKPKGFESKPIPTNEQ